MKVLIAHAEGEEDKAELLAIPLQEAGYEPVHYGTILVGESLTEEAGKVLNSNGPLVLCGSLMTVGTGLAHRLVNAARSRGSNIRIFPVRMAQEAYLEALALDGKIAEYWQNPTKAAEQVIESLKQYYPLNADARKIIHQHGLEARYRELALKSCDIINLANLPEDDRHLASRELELRRLYVALRMRLEVRAGDDADDKTLEALEQRRSRGWGQAQRQYSGEERRVALGERLGEVRRLVVLGDPGAGKSTLLRWLATAYLLRLQQDQDWRDLPDVASLPEKDWLPILIRCRDLPPEAADCLEAMLQHSLRKSEFPVQECTDLCALLRDKLEQGEALLLVDGLDEITEPGARARFAQQIEQISRAYEQAPLIVTSRIVGYREMGYRLRAGFEHLTVADLSREDKDDFARRWCALTERSERQKDAAEELIRDMHSNDRIERLTGNPMLLTTMALIKRKLNRLPQRRVDLYEKAVEVLLNWRSAVDEPLDPREALPQLEYLAHAMCAQGIQQIREDQVLDLLRRVREEYPNIHPLRQHSPEDFLGLLERRTGLLIQSGHTRHKGRSVPVYEFRHLTFQEYLAGISLVQGHYQGRDKSKSLAEVIAPLAGKMEKVTDRYSGEEYAVKENWRESLRLCLAACSDDDVDAALLAILRPLPGEVSTARARAVQAASCLADEPNVNEAAANKLLLRLVNQIDNNDGSGTNETVLDSAVMELATSRWAEPLGEYLLDDFFLHDEEQRSNPGSLYALAQKVHLPSDEGEFISWLTERTVQLIDGEERNVAKTIFSIMIAAFDGKNCQIPGVIDGLIHHLFRNSALSQIAAETLSWMNNNWKGKKDHFWHPTSKQIEQLLTVATKSDCNSMTLLWLATIFGEEKTHQAVSILLPHLPICTARNRITIVEALGAIGDARSTEALIKHLQTISEKRSIRQAAANGVGNVGGKLALEALLTVLNNIIAEDWEVRQTAATALGEIGGERALNALLERVQDTQEEQGVCQAAINALGKIGDKRAVDALLARLLDREEEQENIRHVAVSTLGQIGDERAIDGLLARFLDAKEKPYIQQEAAKALGKIGGERATEVLKPYLENEEKELCRAALGGLAQTCEDELDRKLLSSDLDGIGPWLDPQAAITAALVAKASEKLEQPAEEIASRYKELAQRFGLTMDPESLAIAEENPRTEADQPN